MIERIIDTPPVGDRLRKGLVDTECLRRHFAIAVDTVHRVVAEGAHQLDRFVTTAVA
jgi:hypothetical protein